MADFETETLIKHEAKIELLNFKLTENPPFFIHAVISWCGLKTKILKYEKI